MAGERGSSSDGIDSEEDSNSNHYYTSSLIPKLQFRKESSKAYWREGICMFEVIESKGQLWTTTGIIRGGKMFCSVEEILHMAEMGGISVFLDQSEKIRLSLKDMYKMLEAGAGSSSLHSFLAYKHLKSLGYVLIPPCTPWITKTSQSRGDTCGDTSAAADITADRNQSRHDMWRSASVVDNDSQSWGGMWKTAADDATDAADNDSQSGGDMWHIVAAADIAATGDSSNTVDDNSQLGDDRCHIADLDIASTDDSTNVIDNVGQLGDDMCRIVTLDIADDSANTIDNDGQSGADTWMTISTDNSTNIVDISTTTHDRSESHSDMCNTINTAAATSSQSCCDVWEATAAVTTDDCSQQHAVMCKTTADNHGESCGDMWKAAAAVTTDDCSQPHADTCQTAASNNGESCCDRWKTGSQSCRDRWKSLMPIYKVFVPNSRFRKSSPGEPAFLLCLCGPRHPPPLYSTEEVEEAQRLWPGIPLKLCRVHSGRPFFFSFHNLHLPVLP